MVRLAPMGTGGAVSALVLTLAGCGASQSAPPTPEPQPEVLAAPQEAPVKQTAPLAEQTALVVATAEPTPLPEPAKILSHKLAVTGRGDSKQLLSKQCQEIDGRCDISTITLAIDGAPIAFRPEGTSADAPFGDWEYLDYQKTGADKGQLRMEFASDYEYQEVSWKAGSFRGFEAKRWPKMLEGMLVESSDWDGDGSSEAIYYRCHAFAAFDQPKDCLDTVIYSGETEILSIPDTTISTDILVATLPGNALRIVTTPLDEEYAARLIEIFQMKEGKVEPVWDRYVSGEVKWNKDQSWTVTDSNCERPAHFDYDDDTEKEKLIKFGHERFVKTKYSWDGNAIQTRVQKKWIDRKSRCQSEGRCPYVYAGASRTKLGEILRDQVGTENWRNESIKVPRSLVDKGELLIRIAEEKPDEVTYLDDVWLQVGHQKLRPQTCPDAVCGSDRETMSLAPGEKIELRFSNVPETGEIRLFANGYYRYIR